MTHACCLRQLHAVAMGGVDVLVTTCSMHGKLATAACISMCVCTHSCAI